MSLLARPGPDTPQKAATARLSNAHHQLQDALRCSGRSNSLANLSARPARELAAKSCFPMQYSAYLSSGVADQPERERLHAGDRLTIFFSLGFQFIGASRTQSENNRHSLSGWPAGVLNRSVTPERRRKKKPWSNKSWVIRARAT